MIFELQTAPYIQLNQLLKLLGLVESGGEANSRIAEGKVKVNGKPEFQKRKKIFKEDHVEYEDETINVH